MYLFKHKCYKKAIVFYKIFAVTQYYTARGKINRMGINTHTHDEYVKNDREAFRASATRALKLFGPEDRERARSLAYKRATTAGVAKAWDEQLEPLFSDLEAKRNDPKFKKYLIKALSLSDLGADKAIDTLVNERKKSLLDEVLDNLYPATGGERPPQRKAAEKFLSEPPAIINDFFGRYTDYLQALDLAKKHSVLLCDPYATWLERQRAALAINKERAKTAQNEDARLEEIAIQLDKLTIDQDGLLARIVAMGWDFVTILDLRDKYEKQVSALADTERKSPTKRLKLFEKVTSNFRDGQAELLAEAQDAHTLSQLRAINEDVYNLLLEIFDLPAGERARLLQDIQRHTRLSQERDLILLIQRNREQFLSK